MINKGALLILLSALMYGSYGALYRLTAPTFDAFSLQYTRNLLVIPLTLLLMMVFKNPLQQLQRKDIQSFLIWSVSSGTSMITLFPAFNNLPLSTVYLVLYASMTIVGITMSKLFFNESINGISIVSLILVLIGLAIMYEFEFPNNDLLYIGLTIVSGLSASVFGVYHKKLSTDYSEFYLLLKSSIVVFVMTLSMGIVVQEPIPVFELNSNWFWISVFALVQIIATLSLVVGFKFITVQKGVLLMPTEVVFGVLFGLIFFGEYLTMSLIAGGILILMGAVVPNLPATELRTLLRARPNQRLFR